MSDILRLKKLPLFRLLLPYTVGVMGAYYIWPIILKETKLVIFLLIALLVVVFACFFVRFLNHFFNIVIVAVMILLGVVITSLKVPTVNPDQTKKQYFGVIYERPSLKENSILIPVQVLKIQEVKELQKNIKINLYTSKDSLLLEQLEVGDQITFYAGLNPIENNGNPNEFDYKRFLFNRGVVYQSYTPDSLIKNLGFHGNFRVKRVASTIQEKIITLFQNGTFGSNSRAIIIALTVGNKEYISDELRASFANSGAIHVLAVSGLHVGIIYLILNLLLSFLDRNKKLKVLKTIIVIVFIWGYALLTGFSPSVTRAALMFSLMNIGASLNRDISFFNILAGAALIMLLINPLNIFEVGFQLSFLAVGGIVYFQPVFYQWFSFDNWLVDNMYKLFTVSLAAQITTFPLTIFYFHQFPVYFWLTNILIIPLVSILVGLVVLYLVFSWIPFLATILGLTLNGTAWLTNRWVSAVEHIPGGVIENISISFSILLLLYLLILFISGWLQQRNQGFLIGVLTSIFLIGLLQINETIKTIRSNQLVIYNISKGTAIGLYSKDINQLIFSAASEKIEKNIEYSVKNHWIVKGIASKVLVLSMDSIATKPKQSTGSFAFKTFLLNNKKWVFYNKNYLNQKELATLSANMLIVEPNVFPPRFRLTANTIIVDGRVSLYLSEKWSDYASNYDIHFYDTKKQGAFIFDF